MLLYPRIIIQSSFFHFWPYLCQFSSKSLNFSFSGQTYIIWTYILYFSSVDIPSSAEQRPHLEQWNPHSDRSTLVAGVYRRVNDLMQSFLLVRQWLLVWFDPLVFELTRVETVFISLTPSCLNWQDCVLIVDITMFICCFKDRCLLLNLPYWSLIILLLVKPSFGKFLLVISEWYSNLIPVLSVGEKPSLNPSF